jgi:hypothetical protein
MPQTATRLPKRFPVGSKYVLESCGPLVRRYVEFPDGRKVPLPKRKALPCAHARLRPSSEQFLRRAGERRDNLGGSRVERDPDDRAADFWEGAGPAKSLLTCKQPCKPVT